MERLFNYDIPGFIPSRVGHCSRNSLLPVLYYTPILRRFMVKHKLIKKDDYDTSEFIDLFLTTGTNVNGNNKHLVMRVRYS